MSTPAGEEPLAHIPDSPQQVFGFPFEASDPMTALLSTTHAAPSP
jgi:hypothetical protein